MATIRRDLAHTIVMEWAEHRLKNEDIPGEARRSQDIQAGCAHKWGTIEMQAKNVCSPEVPSGVVPVTLTASKAR